MIKDISFNGLTQSPSDHNCTDGDLATCLNLIPEDGTLKPIGQGVLTSKYKKDEDGSLIPDGVLSLPDDTYSIVYVHKVTHDQDIHSHYIVHQKDEANAIDKWYWMERYGDGTLNEFSLDGFKVNSVAAVGNILCFVGDLKTLSLYWKDTLYSQPFNLSNIRFDFQYKTEPIKGLTGTEDNKDYLVDLTNADIFEDDKTVIDGTKKLSLTIPQCEKIFNSYDAAINKIINDKGRTFFKYYNLAVIAIRSYDGEIVNISNPFFFTPNFVPNRIGIWKFGESRLYADYCIYEILANVNADIPNDIKDIIQSIDLFVSLPESFIDYTKGLTQFFEADNLMPWLPQGNTTGLYKGAFSFKTETEIYNTIDNMSFFLSHSFKPDEWGKNIKINNVDGTTQSLNLSNFYRENIGGQFCISYNNRLHIANVKTSFAKPNNDKISRCWGWDSINNYKSVPSYFSPVGVHCNFTCNRDIDVEDDDIVNSNFELQYLCDSVFKIEFKEGNANTNLYTSQKCAYPLNPIFSFPSTSANAVTLYLKVKGKTDYVYLRKRLELYKSNNFGCSYYINIDKSQGYKDLLNRFWDLGIPCYMQYRNRIIVETDWKNASVKKDYRNYEWKRGYVNEQFDVIKKEDFEMVQNLCTDYITLASSPSLIKVSEAENPLVFPAKNSVLVGSSVVKALATNTQPITEGQFGDAPLYAFTDEGTWMLMLSQDGTYSARQPVNRDICSNPSGILQIDNAVLYPTERGIVIQQGKTSELITDPLDGNAFNFLQMYKEDTQRKIIDVNKTPASDITYIPFREFMKGADMVYDYYAGRIIVYNPDQTYAYVYSLKSKMWGVMHSDLKKRVNIYPEAYAINKDNNIVDLYQSQLTEDTPYFLCTRPFGLDNAEAFKTIYAQIARGYFRNQRGKCGMVLYGSNDLFKWYAIHTSVDKYLRGMCGSPYKYFRLALVGSLAPDESLSGFSTEYKIRWNNKLR